MSKPRVVSGMRPTGRLHLGHLVGALKNWATLQAEVRLLLLRRRLARADERVREHGRRSPATRSTTWPTGSRPASIPERSTIFIQSLVPEHAELFLLLSMVVPVPVARTRADLQGTAGTAVREGPLDARLPRLSAAADGRRRHVRRPLRAGGRGSGAAPRAVARSRAPLSPVLRRGARRAAAAADAGAAAARVSTTAR